MSTPFAPLSAAAFMPTVTRPSAPAPDSEKRPLSEASNGADGSEPLAATATTFVTDTERAGAASRSVGVPARRAQPCASGPEAAQAPISGGTASAAMPPASRTDPGAAAASSTRQSTARTTASTAASASRPNQPVRASLPVPSACTSATGQEAYASQWTIRQAR